MLNTENAQPQLDHQQTPVFALGTTRPVCKKCGSVGRPTIDGRCSDHLTLATEGKLYCVAPEDLGL